MDALEGDPSFEEGGNPFTLNLFMAALDPVLLDTYACSLLGLKPSDVPYIKDAVNLGVGRSVVSAETLHTLNKGEGLTSLQKSSLADTFSRHIHEKGACSACFAALIQALRLMEKERLPLPKTICIGQGFKKESVNSPGVGDCLSGSASFAPGCPPKTCEIVNFLKNQ